MNEKKVITAILYVVLFIVIAIIVYVSFHWIGQLLLDIINDYRCGNCPLDEKVFYPISIFVLLFIIHFGSLYISYRAVKYIGKWLKKKPFLIR